MPAPYFVAGAWNRSSQEANNTLSLALSVPAAAQVRDIVLAFWSTASGIVISSKPADFTTLAADGDSGIYYLYIDNAADIKSYTWTTSGAINDSSDGAQIVYAVYRGVNPDDLIDVYANTNGYDLIGTDVDCPSVTATTGGVGGTLVCMAAASGQPSVLTPQSGMTERWEASSYGWGYIMDKVVSATGATGTQNVDIGSTTAAYWGSASVVLNPGGGSSRVQFIGV